MEKIKRTLRRTLASVPPMSRWLAEMDTLRHQNSKLQSELQMSERRLKETEKRAGVAQEELERIKRAHSIAVIGSEPVWVPPGHFYSPIPAIADLRNKEREIFDPPPAIRGINLNEAQQVELLKTFSEIARELPFTAEKVPGRRYFYENPAYSYTDAIILFCMMRHLRPRRIIEVGSGYSSAAMMDTNELFFDNSIQCTFIDPYPQLLRSLLKDSDRQRVRILGHKVQDIDDSIFRHLEASDIVFIDSSHIVKTGSDVNYILFKIFPLLAAGVYIHIHDIFYPFEYPQEWAFEGRAWNEAYLLRAFLQYNQAFKIRFFASYLMRYHRNLFESGLPLSMKNPGGNIWLEKTLCDPELDRINAPANRHIKSVPRKVDPSSTGDQWLLGEGWYGSETDHCWMSGKATLRVGAPEGTERKLAIRGHSPHVGGALLSVSADDIELGSTWLDQAGPVDVQFLLAANLPGKGEITVELTIDRLVTTSNDMRKLGLAVTAVEII